MRLSKHHKDGLGKKYVDNDPFYSPNLSRKSPCFDIAVD